MKNETNYNDPKQYKKAKAYSIIGKVLGLFFTLAPIIVTIVLIVRKAYDTTLGMIELIISVFAGIYVVQYGIRLIANSKMGGNRDLLVYAKSPRVRLTATALILICIGALGLLIVLAAENADAVPVGIAFLVLLYIGVVLLRKRIKYCEWCGTKLVKGAHLSKEVDVSDFKLESDGKISYAETTQDTHRYYCPHCGFWVDITRKEVTRK